MTLERGRRASWAPSHKTEEQEEQQEKRASWTRRFGDATALNGFHFACGQFSKFRSFHRFCSVRRAANFLALVNKLGLTMRLPQELSDKQPPLGANGRDPL